MYSMLPMTLVEDPRDDYVTCIRYDFFGRRLATVSADAVLRIRDIDDNGMWSVQDGCEIKKTHSGSVWKVDWAHPHFGQLVATCGQDRHVRIWEEHRTAAQRGSRRWMCLLTLTESACAVSDVKFAPRHFGLRIASASEDGNVRIYKANDPSHLSNFLLETPFVPCSENGGVTSISWCPCPFERPLLAVGTSSGLVQVWANTGAKTTDDFGEWVKVLDLQGHGDRAVSCVDWADPMGRSFHRIASCGAHGVVEVHQVTSSRKLEGDEWRHDSTQQLYDGKKHESGAGAWQAQWNEVGTTLTTAGDDGALRVWGMDPDGTWSCHDILYEASIDKKVAPGTSSLDPTGFPTASVAATVPAATEASDSRL